MSGDRIGFGAKDDLKLSEIVVSDRKRDGSARDGAIVDLVTPPLFFARPRRSPQAPKRSPFSPHRRDRAARGNLGAGQHDRQETVFVGSRVFSHRIINHMRDRGQVAAQDGEISTVSGPVVVKSVPERSLASRNIEEGPRLRTPRARSRTSRMMLSPARAPPPEEGKTWDQRTFDTYVYSPDYKISEKKVSHRVDSLRRSDAFNDDSFEYALVIALGAPPATADEDQGDVSAALARVDTVAFPRPGETESENADPNARVDAKRSDKRKLKVRLRRRSSRVLRGVDPSVCTRVMDVIDRLHRAGLRVRVDPHAIDGCALLKLSARPSRLEAEAERVGLKVRLDNGRFAPYERRLHDHVQASLSDPNSIFRSCQRQQLIQHILKSRVSEGGVDIEALGARVVKAFPLHMYTRVRTLRHFWLKFWEAPGEVDHDPTGAPGPGTPGTRAPVSMAKIVSLPLDRIALYFGEEVAFHHAWMAFLTRWLLFPSVLGVVLFASLSGAGELDSPLVPFFCVGLVIWSNLFILHWRQRSSYLAYRWGVYEYEQADEAARPEYYGDTRRNELTGELEIHYPAWKRCLKLMVSGFVHACIVTSSFSLLVVAFGIRDQYLSDREDADDVTFTSMFKSGVAVELLFVPMLLAVVIPLADWGYRSFALVLTRWENWKFESTYQKAYIVKMFSFRFVNTFLYMYYVAFATSSTVKLSAQLFSFILAGIVFRWTTRVGWPAVLHLLSVWQLRAGLLQASRAGVSGCQACCWCCCFRCADGAASDQQSREDPEIPELVRHEAVGNSSEGAARTRACLWAIQRWFRGLARALSPVRIQRVKKPSVREKQCRSRLYQHHRDIGSTSQAWRQSHQPLYSDFEDYYSMMIMFGYVVFFSASFPLAPLLVLASNLVELRLSAYKMCSFTQRPAARRASGIGIWITVLQVMSIIGVLTNVAIIGFKSKQITNWFPSLSPASKVFVIFLFEHILLGMHYLTSLLIPATPKSLKKRMVYEKHLLQRERLLVAKPRREGEHAESHPQGGPVSRVVA